MNNNRIESDVLGPIVGENGAQALPTEGTADRILDTQKADLVGLREACENNLSKPGEIEILELARQVCSYISVTHSKNTYEENQVRRMISNSIDPESYESERRVAIDALTDELIANLRPLVDQASEKGYLNTTPATQVVVASGLSSHLKPMISEEQLQASYDQMEQFLQPFRGCTVSFSQEWTFPDRYSDSGGWFVFSKGGQPFGVVQLRYGFGDGDPEHDLVGSSSPYHGKPMVIISTIQGVSGVNIADLGVNGEAKRLMQEAFCSSCKEMLKLGWVVGMSPGGHSKHDPNPTLKSTRNFRLLTPLFREIDYYDSGRMIHMGKGSTGSVSGGKFFRMRDANSNKRLRKLFSERDSG